MTAGRPASGSCSQLSLAAGEQLAGSATEGRRFLLVQVDRTWGRDAVADTPLPDGVRAALDAFAGKVVLVREPRERRRDGHVTVIDVTVSEEGGEANMLVLPSLGALPDADLRDGEPLRTPLVLVCVHGRRDACCARLGPPLYAEAVAAGVPVSLWQCSHLGGHRFAPNVLALPGGVQLGRVPAGRAAQVVSLLAAGRIPLDLYRGRTLYPPHVQAAEVALRTALGLDHVGDLRLLDDEGGRVAFASPGGRRTVAVARSPGPPAPASCGAEPEPTAVWTARLESAA